MDKPYYAITGHRGVLAKSLLSSGEFDWIGFEGDVRHADEVQEWLASAGRERNIDGVIHLAAMVPTQAIEADPLKAFETNVLGTVQVLKSIRSLSASSNPWFFFASTSHVYQPTRSAGDRLNEESTTQPFTLYGKTTLDAEHWIDALCRAWSIQACVGRIFSFSGPEQPHTYFLPAMVNKIRGAQRDSTLEIHGLHGTRDFMHVDQVADAIRFLLRSRPSGVFNIGTGTGVRLLDLVDELKGRLGREDLKIVSTDSGTQYFTADPSRLASLGHAIPSQVDALLDSFFK